MRHIYIATILSGLVFGCDGTDEPAPGTNQNQQSLECQADVLPDDFTMFGPLEGPGVDADGSLRASDTGNYVVSSTYLRLHPTQEANDRFMELMGPISMTLANQPGLIALQTGGSMSCGTARTFTVWESEEAMYSFVASDAHANGIANVAQVSRGGSIVTHWDADTLEKATWDEALRQLSQHEGPVY